MKEKGLCIEDVFEYLYVCMGGSINISKQTLLHYLIKTEPIPCKIEKNSHRKFHLMEIEKDSKTIEFRKICMYELEIKG